MEGRGVTLHDESTSATSAALLAADWGQSASRPGLMEFGDSKEYVDAVDGGHAGDVSSRSSMVVRETASALRSVMCQDGVGGGVGVVALVGVL